MIKKEWFNTKLTLWQKIRLFFKPKFVAVDFGSDETCVVWSKRIDGKIVILKTKKEGK